MKFCVCVCGRSWSVTPPPPRKWGPAALDPAESARLCAAAAPPYRMRRAPRGRGPLGGGQGSCAHRRLGGGAAALGP
jgi:hypothetical protein